MLFLQKQKPSDPRFHYNQLASTGSFTLLMTAKYSPVAFPTSANVGALPKTHTLIYKLVSTRTISVKKYENLSVNYKVSILVPLFKINTWMKTFLPPPSFLIYVVGEKTHTCTPNT